MLISLPGFRRSKAGLNKRARHTAAKADRKMPSSLPYDPNLSIGHVITPDILELLRSIRETEFAPNHAEALLEGVSTSKRALELTKAELSQLGIDTRHIDEQLKKLDSQAQEAAKEHATAKSRSENEIKELKQQKLNAPVEFESPIDLERCEIRPMPIASDSINLDVEYFNFNPGETRQKGTVAAFVTSASGWKGIPTFTELASAVQKKLSQRTESTPLAGTLVISANCIHKNASMLSPFVLDIESAFAVWNKLFPADKVDMEVLRERTESALRASDNDREYARRRLVEDIRGATDETSMNQFGIVSGTTYGSAFVGMIHVPRSSDPEITSKMFSLASLMQEKMYVGSFLGSSQGAYTLMGDLRRVFDTNSIQTLVEVVQVKEESISTSSPDRVTTTEMPSVDSLATALNDFVQAARSSTSGIPVSYYLKDINKTLLLEAWIAKRLTNKHMNIPYDNGNDNKVKV